MRRHGKDRRPTLTGSHGRDLAQRTGNEGVVVNKNILALPVGLLTAVIASGHVAAQSLPGAFAGKTVTLIVGFGTNSQYDSAPTLPSPYSRTCTVGVDDGVGHLMHELDAEASSVKRHEDHTPTATEIVRTLL
jgi:hypothetical protein